MIGRAMLAFACLLGCSTTRTQAVVTVEVDAALLGEISRIEVHAVDAVGDPSGTGEVFDMRGKQAVTPPFSFGALPDENGTLRLRIVGFNGDARLIEQVLAERLSAGGIARITVLLREQCRLDVCGESPGCAVAQLIEGAFSCDSSRTGRGPGEGASDTSGCDESVSECGEPCASDDDSGCQDASVAPDARVEIDTGAKPGSESCRCNQAHIEAPHCAGDECDGKCEVGYDDCDKDKKTNGCETNLNKDPNHCGKCADEASVCPYGVCEDAVCRTGVFGYLNSDGTREVTWRPSRMQGQLLYVSEDAMVAGLGIRAVAGGDRPDASFMLGLYETRPDMSPGSRVASTPPMTVEGLRKPGSGMVSVYGGLEHPVLPKERVRKGESYWMFLISSASLGLLSQPIASDWQVSVENVSFSGLAGEMPLFPSAGTFLVQANDLLGNLYVVTTPIP